MYSVGYLLIIIMRGDSKPLHNFMTRDSQSDCTFPRPIYYGQVVKTNNRKYN